MTSDVWDDYLDLKKQETVTFGPNTEKLLKTITKDFSYFTILMVVYNDQKRTFRPAEIAGMVNEPKKLVKQVMQHFVEHAILRENGKFTKTYAYIPNNHWDATIYNLVKLWKHPKTHDTVLRKLLSA